jgi:hypothetical protein
MNAEFEALVLNEISKAWSRYAYSFGWIKSLITPPHFKLHDGVQHWGRWTASTREMSFSRHLVTDRPWGEVLEVVKHEMAHQYVSEILHIEDEPPHGITFQNVCKNHNIDAAPRGIPGADKIDTTNHIVEKVRKLLALAKNDNENESKLAAEMAHNIMLKYNIELQEKNDERGYTVRFFGKITGRIQAYMTELANILSKYYFVEIIWVSTFDPRSKKTGHELEVSGTEDNVEVAEYVHDFVTRSALEAWEKKFSSPAFKEQMKAELDSTWNHYDAPHSAKGYTISARSNFLAGFVRGFASQLKQAEIKEQSEGLVLRRDPALEAFYHTRHPHIRKLARGKGYYNHRWQGEGFAQGQSLNMPPAAKAGKKSTPLLGK